MRHKRKGERWQRMKMDQKQNLPPVLAGTTARPPAKKDPRPYFNLRFSPFAAPWPTKSVE